MDNCARKVAVLGFGKRNGCDDEAGLLACDLLKEFFSDEICVDFFEPKADEIPQLLSVYQFVILVDVGDVEKLPGNYIRTSLEELCISGLSKFSRHADFSGALSLLQKCARLPHTAFYILQEDDEKGGCRISKELGGAIDSVVRDITSEIQDILVGGQRSK